MPRGFAIGHAKWWTNQLFPVCILLAVSAALYQLVRTRAWGWSAAVALSCSAIWIGAAIGLARYPVSGLWLAPLAVVIGVIGLRAVAAAGAIRIFRGGVVAGVLGAGVGFVALALQRAHEPATFPANPTLAPEPDAEEVSIRATQRISDRTAIWPRDGEIRTEVGRLQLTIEPALQFISRSPDRFWTVFAAAREGVSPPTQLLRAAHGPYVATFDYRSDYDARLSVADDGQEVRIHSTATLTRPIFSHLNSFARVLVTGHRRLFLSFSPCPDARVEVLPSDYPVGRPARAAFLTDGDRFCVVEASGAEKGPFRVLADGPLKRSEPLIITLLDEDQPMGRISWLDWAAQADTSPSPTAGWGAPCNAIEFSLVGDRPSDAAALYLTLAGTSLGRGWDSVGHAAGTYQNRMRIDSAVGKP